jgi:predicted dehydrogenase
LRDIGVYTLGSARFVTGAEAEAVDSRLIRENGIDTFALVFGTMAGNGAAVHLSFDDLDAALQPAGGDDPGRQGHDPGRGRAVQRQRQRPGEAVELHVEGNRVITDRFPTANHYVLQVEAFGRSIRDGAPYPCPLEFVQGTQRMMDMAYDRAVDIQP